MEVDINRDSILSRQDRKNLSTDDNVLSWCVQVDYKEAY